MCIYKTSQEKKSQKLLLVSTIAFKVNQGAKGHISLQIVIFGNIALLYQYRQISSIRSSKIYFKILRSASFETVTHIYSRYVQVDAISCIGVHLVK